MPETIKLPWSTKYEITKDKNGENVPHLEITEVALVHCNFANSNYQQNSRVLYTYGRNKPFSSLLEIAPTNFIPLKTFNSEFSYIEVWFTDQTSQPLEIENRINLALVINWYSCYKNVLFIWIKRSNMCNRLWIFVYC